MSEKKTHLAQMIAEEQVKKGLSEREAAAAMGVIQQTYSAWKRGVIPRDNKRQAVVDFLGISFERMQELVDQAAESIGATKLPRMGSFDLARQYGRVVDRKEGKYKFDTSRKAVPEGRYAIAVDTKVMEPALRVGTKAWIDPAVFSKPGDEVIVHTSVGFSWIGILEGFETGKATITQPNGERREINKVVAVHTIVLAERI